MSGASEACKGSDGRTLITPAIRATHTPARGQLLRHGPSRVPSTPAGNPEDCYAVANDAALHPGVTDRPGQMHSYRR
jgi:hypothetical protein